MARELTLKDLEHIDELVAFYVESNENARLLRVMTALVAVSNAKGADVVFAKRLRELERS